MSIENQGFHPEEIRDINNSLSKNEELRKTKEILEKRETIGGQEKLEAYLNYLVDWKNEIIAKQNKAKKQVEEILVDLNMSDFSLQMGSDTLFAKLAEQFEEIQNERNEWAKKIALTIYGSPYTLNNIHYPHDKPELVRNNFFAPLEGNEHLKKSIEALGLNIYEYPTVFIPNKTLEGDLPLYEMYEDADAISERWLRIENDKYIVETKYEQKDKYGNYSHNEKEYDSYKEAVKRFLE